MLTAREPEDERTRLVVDRLWCVSDATADGYETLLPSGRAQVLFSLSGIPIGEHDPDLPAPGSGALHVFQGPSTFPRRISRKPQIALCGASFHPGGAGALFGPIHGTADRVIDLARLWGGDAARLGDRLRDMGTHGAPVPDFSIEVEDVDTVYRRATEMGFKIVHDLRDEPWGVRRFFITDPTGKLLNILSHLR